jgi:hypothetical protein
MSEYELMLKHFDDEYHETKKKRLEKEISEILKRGLATSQEIEKKRKELEEELDALNEELKEYYEDRYDPDHLVSDIKHLMDFVDRYKDVIGIYEVNNETGDEYEITIDEFKREIDPTKVLYEDIYDDLQIGYGVDVNYLSFSIDAYEYRDDVAELVSLDPNRIIGAVRVRGEGSNIYGNGVDFDLILVVFKKSPDEALYDYLASRYGKLDYLHDLLSSK